MNKSELRALIRNEKRRFSQQELAEASLPIIRRLAKHPRMKAANTVLMYYSLPDEVFTHGIIDCLRNEGKTVVLPVVISDGMIELRRYNGYGSLKAGAYGIKEPCGPPFTAVDTLDLAVVPGMAFDVRGNRLGRGKGFYDRFLTSTPNVYKLGVCFDFQKVPAVPVSEHDVPVDEVL